MTAPLSILIGCETSGVVRRAMAARGHDVWSCDLLPGEAAASVVGFPAYIVTSEGRVFSTQGGKLRLMKHRPHRAGYKLITLCAPGKRLTTTVHRLIASVFVPNPEGLPVVRHLDGNKTHNAASNLAWGTYADNEADKIGHGTRRYGTAKMKMNRAQRDEALRLHRAGWSRADLAARYEVNRSTITRLINGNTWVNRKWPMAEKAAAR